MQRRTLCHLLVALVLLASCAHEGGRMSGPPAGASFFVSPRGDDRAPGTRRRPFATLERAREAVRSLKTEQGLPPGGITVWLAAGTYLRDASFTLDAHDSGADGAPVVWRARQNGTVILSGGRALDAAAFVPLCDAALRARFVDPAAGERVLQLDLARAGIDPIDPLEPRGMSRPVRPAPVELFVDDQPMTLARWPNEGFAKTGPVVDPGAVPRQGDGSGRAPMFHYLEDRPSRWTAAEDPWLMGYWMYDWADESIPIAAIDAASRTIILAGPHHYGVAEGKEYFAENLLEEIDTPGEYYIDRGARRLYFWPPAPLAGAHIVLSVLKEPLVSLESASHVTLRGIAFETSRAEGVHIAEGTGNLVAGCTFRNLGTTAVGVAGGTSHGVAGCDVYRTGQGGIYLSGGDRERLVPAGHFAENNDISDYSRWTRTNRPGISLDGVGSRAAHNWIHDAPHMALRFAGNDHIIEYNRISHVLSFGGDAGAIYTGRDYTYFGNVIRYNFLHDLHGIHKYENGIYLDDQASGITVFGNVLLNGHWGMLLGGGHHLRVENNLIVNFNAALHFDARALGWYAPNIESIMVPRLVAMPYRQPPWSERFPQLLTLLDGNPAVPAHNSVRHNVVVRSGAIDAHMHPAVKEHGSVGENYVTDDDPGFVDFAGRNLQLRDDSPVWEALPGFERIPFERIGLYVDGNRTRLPPGP